MHHKEKHDNLILADIDEMRKHTYPQDDPGKPLLISIFIKDIHLYNFISAILDGKYKALIIEMCLKSSSYATMALREILKNDTSAETQAALSASHDTENSQLTVNAEDVHGRELADNIHKNNVKICEELTDVNKDETIKIEEESISKI